MAIIKTKLTDGTELFIETDEPAIASSEEDDEYRDTPKVVEKIIDSGKNLFGEAMNNIQACANEITTAIDKMQDKIKPDEIETTLAFKLKAGAGVVLTNIEGEAQLQVKLVWKNRK